MKIFLIGLFFLSSTLFASDSLTGKRVKPTNPDKEVNAEIIHSAFLIHLQNITKENIENLPVQHRGRIKPFDTFARESNLYLMGSSSKWGQKATQIYLGLLTFPKASYLEFIEVRDLDVRVKLGYEKKKRFFSVAQLKFADLNELASPALAQEKKNKHELSDLQKGLIEVAQQFWLAQGIIGGSQLFEAIIYKDKGKVITSNTSIITTPLQNYLRSLSPEQPQAVASQWSSQLIQAVSAQANTKTLHRQIENIDLEVTYNKAHLFMIVGILYLLLAIAIFLPYSRQYLSSTKTYFLLSLPILIHTIGFIIRIFITEFPPVTNMYGTMLWVSYGISVMSILFYYLYKDLNLLSIFLVGAALIIFITEFFPLILGPGMDPIVAVLRSSYWLTIHVLTITLSYAAFSLSLLLGNIALVKYIIHPHIPETDKFYKNYGHYAYRSIQLGVFLITAGIILGGIWADYSWGRFWGWDPKETWALIADLGYLLILHSRISGWLGPFGLLAMSTVAYLLVIMAWYGVNFILAAGLHSYGFSSGGAQIVFTFVGGQLILLSIVGVIYLIRKNKLKINR
ncbi:MAG: cytochrome c biogenesis protein CcsA [Bacteriovoracaceae bacterium]|jgi:ABC-type transport system involved in cytochrome c biogenesis permease subunit|nr:cytochrome c biogenesis protein CcsA [Bacteriovoracaceae bacterium]